MSRFPTGGHLASWCGVMSGPCREHGQTAFRPHQQRQPLCAAGAGAGGLGGSSRQPQTDVFHDAVLSDQQPGRNEECRRGRGAPAPLRYLLMILTGSSYREQGADHFDRVIPSGTENDSQPATNNSGFSSRSRQSHSPNPAKLLISEACFTKDCESCGREDRPANAPVLARPEIRPHCAKVGWPDTSGTARLRYCGA